VWRTTGLLVKGISSECESKKSDEPYLPAVLLTPVMIILFTCSDWLLLKVSLFKSFHPCCHLKATACFSTDMSTIMQPSNKVVLSLVISCSSICPLFFCETIVEIFTAIEIFALFCYFRNCNAVLPNGPCYRLSQHKKYFYKLCPCLRGIQMWEKYVAYISINIMYLLL
jgi:hypothetical protein